MTKNDPERIEDEITPPKPEVHKGEKIAPVDDYPERPYRDAISPEHKKWLKDNGYPIE